MPARSTFALAPAGSAAAAAVFLSAEPSSRPPQAGPRQVPQQQTSRPSRPQPPRHCHGHSTMAFLRALGPCHPVLSKRPGLLDPQSLPASSSCRRALHTLVTSVTSGLCAEGGPVIARPPDTNFRSGATRLSKCRGVKKSWHTYTSDTIRSGASPPPIKADITLVINQQFT